MNAINSLEDLVVDASLGNEAAWWLLWEQVEPQLERILSNPRVLGRLSQNTDDVRNILVKVMDKLLDKECRRLKKYVEQKSTQKERLDPSRGGFSAWLAVVTKRTAIDYMRSHDEYLDLRNNKEHNEIGQWVILAELPSNSQIFGNRPAVTNRGSALALLHYAYTTLPDDQMAALEKWILNIPYSTIAEELNMSSGQEARKKVRAALERIRRRFRDSTEGKSNL